MSSWLLRTDTIVPFFFRIKYLFLRIYTYFGVMNCIKFILHRFLSALRKIGVEVLPGLKTTGRTLAASSSQGIPSVLLWPMKCLFSIDLLFISETLTFSCLVFKTLSRLLRVLSVLKGRAVLIVLPIKSIKSLLFDNLTKTSNTFWRIKSWFENLKLNFSCQSKITDWILDNTEMGAPLK